MKKPIRTFKINVAPLNVATLTSMLCDRSLLRRRKAFSAALAQQEWLEQRKAEHEAAKVTARRALTLASEATEKMTPGPPLTQAKFEDGIAPVSPSRASDTKPAPVTEEPSYSQHPDFPKAISEDERTKIFDWSKRRTSAMHTATSLPESVKAAQILALRNSGLRTEAVYLSEHEVDVAFSAIHADFPWLGVLNEKAWKQARRRSVEGRPTGIGPLVLLGPTGLGKSTWARAVADRMGVPRIDVDVGATGGMMDLQGTGKGWGSSSRGRVVSTIIDQRIANPMIVLDEIDAGSSVGGSTGGSLPGLHKVMMGLIEPSTARSWICPYYQIPFDMSHLSWICTSNNIAHVDQSLLDRMTVLTLPDLTGDQLKNFAAAQAKARLGDDFVQNVLDNVDQSLRNGHRLSLRHVTRLLDRTAEAIGNPQLH